ncbi:MAG: bifunctional metallophosphatase/5'-nucleotidase [Deltaproteobacteria bacterium]|nr:MAG: bifunctional metallophosphatase/5'-nucleotidase [Deltaproteobacteria bacterium]
MRRIVCVVVCALAAACGGSDSRRLVLLHTNDEHSHLLGFGPEADEFPIVATRTGTGSIVGGASRRSTILAQERQKAKNAGADSLTVSAGDNLIGSLAQLRATVNAPDYKVMSLLGYDVTTLGNHEFDFGPDTLAQVINAATAAGAKVPIVSSNIHFSGNAGALDAPLKALFDETGKSATAPVHRYLVLTTPQRLKVGFVGIVGADAANVAPLKAPVTFSVDPRAGESNLAASLAVVFSDVQSVVDRMRFEANPDVVVALSHSGLDPTSPAALDASEDAQIAHHVSGIDVIVSGHSHTQVKAFTVKNDKTGKDVVIQQAGRFGDAVGRITLNVSNNGTVSFDAGNSAIVAVLPLSFMQITLAHIKGAVPEVPATAGSLLFAPLSQLTFDVDNTGAQRETALLDLTADAMLFALNNTAALVDAKGNAITGLADMAAEGAGVLRVSKLERGRTGVLGFGDVFRAVPLGGSKVSGTPGYPLTRFAISGFELRAAFEVTAGLAYSSAGNAQFFLVPSGMKFIYDTNRPLFTTSDILNPNAGRVTQISQASNDPTVPDAAPTLIYDGTDPALASTFGWKAVSPNKLYTIATSLYVASFASLAGVKLKNPANPAEIYTDPEQAIVRRQDGSEIKEWEALGTYIAVVSKANGGNLPVRYDGSSATFAGLRRTTCKGALCEP